jgi:hypothetical protein
MPTILKAKPTSITTAASTLDGVRWPCASSRQPSAIWRLAVMLKTPQSPNSPSSSPRPPSPCRNLVPPRHPCRKACLHVDQSNMAFGARQHRDTVATPAVSQPLRTRFGHPDFCVQIPGASSTAYQDGVRERRIVPFDGKSLQCVAGSPVMPLRPSPIECQELEHVCSSLSY